MIARLLAKLGRHKRSARQSADTFGRFFRRFVGRTVIVHCGLSIDWLAELLTLGGGGGHLRFDIRQRPSSSPRLLEKVIAGEVLALALPLPLMLKVEPGVILVRHLIRDGTICHPSEIAWMLDEIGDRFHAALRLEGGRLHCERGLLPEENEVRMPQQDLS